MSDESLLKRVRANKWTIFVLTLGLVINMGLTRLGRSKNLTWHEVHQIQQWKEVVFGLVLAQSGKALRRNGERETDAEGIPKLPNGREYE